MIPEEHMKAEIEPGLGDNVECRLTGFRGKVDQVINYLYGSARARVQPYAVKDGQPVEATWFDIGQLKKIE